MSKRKKHSKLRRYDRMARAHTKDIAVVCVGQDEPCYLVDVKRMKLLSHSVNRTLAEAVASVRYKWAITLAAFGVAPGGQKYTKTQLIKANEEYHHSDLVGVASENHGKLLDTMNTKQLVNVGWIASPAGADYPQEVADKVFDLLKPFEGCKS